MKQTIFGAWNVRTLMDRETSTRPERRRALVAKELSHYSNFIAALSETRLADEGSVAELKGGYTFFWKGKAQAEERIHGIGLAMKTSILKQLPDFPSTINERLKKLRFPLTVSRHITIINAYAPTMTTSYEAKETFYEDLNNLVKDVPQNNLTITNTLFRQADKYKSTWMHPRSKQWHLIDYIICRRRNARDFGITRAMRGAECWTDHRLVRSVVKLYIAPTRQKRPKLNRPSFNIAKLNYSDHQDHFVNSLDDKVTSHGPLTGSPTQKWDHFSSMVKEEAQSIPGPKKRVHQDWFDENDQAITQLLDEKQKAFVAWQNELSSISKRDDFKHLQHRAQTTLRHMQDEWWKNKAQEVQLWADVKNSKMFFSTIKAVSSTVSNEALHQIPQRSTIDSPDLPPSMEQVQKAIKQTSSGKAPGKDGIPAEIYKAARQVTLNAFHSLLCSIWEEEDNPQEFRDATIISLYKNKGSKSDCGNYRGISLLSIAGLHCGKFFKNLVFPRKFVTQIRLFHDSMTGLVLSGGEASEPFEITNGVKQGCVLAPVLFNLFFACILSHSVKDIENGVYIRRHIKLVERFHMRGLRSILGIKWQDMITNLVVLDRAETTSIAAMILKAQLRWTGHIIRMDSDRIPKQLLYGVLSKGKRKQGRSLKRFKDCINANIACTGIATKQLEECAEDRTGWRASTREATKALEAHRRANVTKARAKRKTAAETPKPPGQFPCSHCGRVCRSRLGLLSHQRTHPRT
ncbi:Craniofacial development protein 2 [Stylophora pistillata]|uniref:Craniofacial development protein 2 n=1 Tax=Stylophora pistillata TaxID=50429 RepID=A0A2B4R7Z6_STYPI|nr:Craniofacial development protein 2 [Stylophora pistillata]